MTHFQTPHTRNIKNVGICNAIIIDENMLDKKININNKRSYKYSSLCETPSHGKEIVKQLRQTEHTDLRCIVLFYIELQFIYIYILMLCTFKNILQHQ